MLGPLGANVQIAERLLKKVQDKELKKMAKTFLISSKLLQWHANDLLDQSIIENGRLVATLNYGSANEAILELVPLVESIIGHKSLTFEWRLDGVKDLYLKFDKQRLQQLVLNLASNAIKFQQHGVITVKAVILNLQQRLMHDSKDESLLEVTVADTGIGMTPEELQRIFVPFNTTENRVSQSMNPRGHGVGLSICKQICKNLGGDITVKS